MNWTERCTVNYVRQLIRRWEDRLFATDDQAASERGWQISRRPNGHGRRYRDPRWDLISACQRCDGSGAVGAAACAGCGGRGTVRLDQAAATNQDTP